MLETAKNLIKGIALKKIFLFLISPVGLISSAVIGLLFIIIVTIVGLNSEDDSVDDFDLEEVGEQGLSPHVLKHKKTVVKYAKEYEVESHVPLILGMMQQESGGNPSESDPMQSSESLCGTIGCITDPEKSIEQGVKYFSEVLKDANDDPLLAIASYNMGGGFISYFHNQNGEGTKFKLNKVINGKKTSKDLISFSQKQYQKNPSLYNCSRSEGADINACHGDIMYVDAVLSHVNSDEENDVNVKGDKTFPLPYTDNITSPFDPNRLHPIEKVIKPHNGIDIAGGDVYGRKVVSFMSGKVTHASMTGSAGNMIQVEHTGGLTTVYMHLSKMDVKVGQEIKVGEKIGEVGNTGGSTAPHLHFETRVNGNAVNPKKFLDKL